MKKVKLLGTLGDKFGTDWEMKASSYKDIFSCIEANEPGFRQHLINMAQDGMGLEIVTGEEIMQEVDELLVPISSDTIYITDLPAGASSGGAKILVGALLIGATFLIPGVGAALGTLFTAGTFSTSAAIGLMGLGIGLNLAMVGLQQILAPDPSVDEREDSSKYAGPRNTVSNNPPVPALLGELYIQGQVISSGVVGGSRISGAHTSTSIMHSNPYSLAGVSAYDEDNLPSPSNTLNSKVVPVSSITPVGDYYSSNQNRMLANQQSSLGSFFREVVNYDSLTDQEV